MLVSRILSAALLCAFLACPALAADAQQRNCLNKTEQRTAVTERKAITLAQAVKILREHGDRAELVRAQLCHRGDSLAYVLTLLPRSGKVTLATVDAATGELLNGR